MTKRVDIQVAGKDVGAQPLLRSTRGELLGISRDADRASESFRGMYARANPGANTLTGLRAVRNTLLGIVAAGAAAGASLIPAANREQSQAQFAKMLKSAELAKKLLRDLEQTAAATPLQMGGIESVARRLLGAQIPLERMTTLVQRLGDAAGGNAERMDRLTNAYAKTAVKGRASMEDLNMFMEAGVPIIGALAKHFGIAENEVFKFSQTGRIGFKDLDDALRDLTTGSGLMAGQMAAMAETAAGKWSTLKDNLVLAAAQIGQGMLPAVKTAMDDILAEIQRLRESGELERWGRRAAVAVEGVYDALKTVASFIAKHGKLSLTIGGGLLAGRGIAGLATHVIMVKGALAQMRTQALVAGQATNGMVTAQTLNQLANAKVWLNGMTGATNKAGAAAAATAAKMGMLTTVATGGAYTALALAVAALVKNLYDLRTATNETQDALDKLEDATGEYANNGFWKNIASIPANMRNYLDSLTSGRPMAIAGEGAMIEAGPGEETEWEKSTREMIRINQRLDRQRERAAAQESKRSAQRKANWSSEMETFARQFGIDDQFAEPAWVKQAMAVAAKLSAMRKEAFVAQETGDINNVGLATYRKVTGLTGAADFSPNLGQITDAATEAGNGDAGVGLEVLLARAKDEMKAIHKGSDQIAKAEAERQKKIAKGIEASKRLGELERTELQRSARLYATDRLRAAQTRAAADRKAERQADTEQQRRTRRARSRWDQILHGPSPKEQRQAAREKRKEDRTKERYVRKAVAKVTDGRADELTTRDRRALLARRDEILASRAGRRARRHGRAAGAGEAAGRGIEDRIRQEDRRQQAERFVLEKRALEAVVRTAERAGERWGGKKRADQRDPAALKLCHDVGRIADALTREVS